MAGSNLMWLLGTQLGSSAGAVNAVICGDISPAHCKCSPWHSFLLSSQGVVDVTRDESVLFTAKWSVNHAHISQIKTLSLFNQKFILFTSSIF